MPVVLTDEWTVWSYVVIVHKEGSLEREAIHGGFASFKDALKMANRMDRRGCSLAV